jgi:hypothetical protein
MCVRTPIPPTITVLFDPDAVQQHPFDMDYESDAETIPWTFNANAAEFTPNGNIFEPTRGTTRVWADMVDSDAEDEPMQETAAQRHARRLEEARLDSLQDIAVIDALTFRVFGMETDGNTLVGEVHRFSAAHFGLNTNSFILSYAGQPLTNGMDITSITEDDVAIGAIHTFNIIRRPLAFNIEFRTVEHGTIRLSVQLTDSVDSLYTRISFLTGWGIQYFTLRYENHPLDNWDLDMSSLGIYGDTFMVMVGSLAGGTQRFNIGSPCAAAATRLDESDISDMEIGSESSTSMPDLARLVVAGSAASGAALVDAPAGVHSAAAASSSSSSSSSSSPSVLVGFCPLHPLPSSPSAAAAVNILQVQGLKRNYVNEGAQGRTYQRFALFVPVLVRPGLQLTFAIDFCPPRVCN